MLGQNTNVLCEVTSSEPESVLIEWTTTALSADISNRNRVNSFRSVDEALFLTNVDSGYCGVYTCSTTDKDTTIPQSSSISLSVGE